MARSFPKQTERYSKLGFFFLLIYSVALFVRPQEWSYTPDPFPIARIFLILAFLFFVLEQTPKRFGYQGILLIGMTLIIILSGLRNYDPMGGINKAIDFSIYAVVPFLLFSNFPHSVKRQRILFYLLVISCAVMLHHGISQKLSPEGIGWSGEELSQGTRITFLGFFNDPNDLGMFFLMNIPILFYLKSTSNNFIIKIIFFVMILGLIYGVYLTNSRGTLVGLLAMIFTYFYFRFGKIKTFFLTMLFAPAAYIAMKLFRTIDSQEQSANDRIQAWYEGIQMFKYRPLFGIGKDEFVQAHGLTAHNSYVLIWAELGILGYLLWTLALYLTLLMLVKIFMLKEVKNLSKEVQNDILLAKCLFYSFMGFLSTAFFLSRSYVVFLYTFIGIAVAVFYRTQKEVTALAEINWKTEIYKGFGLSMLSLVVLYMIIVVLL